MSEPTGKYYAPGYGPLPGQPGYGEPIPGPYGPPAYEQTQYGPSFGSGRPPLPPSGGTVITAAVIQIVQASLYILGALGLLLLAGLVNGVGDEIHRRSDGDLSVSTDTLAGLVAVAGLLLLASGIFLIVLAALAIRGRRWAAITSVVVQALVAALGLLGLSLVGTTDFPAATVVSLLASAAVAVLFLLPASTTYYAARTALRG